MRLFRQLLEHPDPGTLTPGVVDLIHQAGNPFFDWFFDGPAVARAALERLFERPSSEIAASHVTVLLDENRLAGIFVALDGAELARCRKADTLALLEQARSPESRSALLARMRAARGLFTLAEADELYLSKIGVVAGQRRSGYGRALLAKYMAAGFTAGFSRFRLDVSADNEPAIALYRSAGFRLESEREAGPLRYVSMALEHPLHPGVALDGFRRRPVLGSAA
jgi:ribosomal protein S18 acetylase RimI-like enzyme